MIDLAEGLGDANIVLSKDSGCGPSGSASKRIQNRAGWMVGIKSCSLAHVMIRTAHYISNTTTLSVKYSPGVNVMRVNE